VLLVTGGGKGIAAECALALARATGVRLALLGRSAPDADSELSQNLDRFIAAGAKCCYVRADVTDAADVSAAVRQAEEALGPITALVHGAGTNTPCLVQNLNAEAFHKTMRPKVQGLENVLAALPTEQMRMLVTFSSIIARTGLAGEADYATANEWLTARTELFAAEHPACRCLALEWSVWSGVGMGERLGRIETLIQHGITPLSVDQGVRIFLDLVQRPLHKVAVIAAGRFGAPPALRMRAHALPLRRFLERPRVYYPEVELIVDAELTETSDPYFADHVLEQEPLLPAVIGLEAMAQAALALAGADRLLALERVELIRPVVASKTATKIRLAALRRAQDLVEVCLRAEQTDFQVDHFRALCRLPGTTTGSSAALNSDDLTGNNAGARGRFGDTLSLDPAQDLYGRLLFHKNRFCRVRSYRLLTARECIAELAPAGPATWFGPYMPAELVLGDPGARDAALHSIQACIPHQRILPTGIDRLIIHNCPSTSGTRFVHACERTRAGNDFVYDVEVTNETGVVLETWKGLRLRAVQALTPNGPWPVALLGPYLERRLEELVTDSHVRVALGRDATLTEAGPSKASRRNTDSLLSRVMGKPASIRHRPDGKPELSMPQGSAAITSDRRRGLLSLPDDDEERNHTSLSVAHARNLTLVVADGANVACDVEPVVARDEHAWRDLLGDARFVLAARIGREQQEAADNAATRLWAAAECLKKAGQAPEAPLVLQAETPDGWVVLRSGALAIVTCVLKIDQIENSLALAVALYEP
jgi:enediyne polyketide synthase